MYTPKENKDARVCYSGIDPVEEALSRMDFSLIYPAILFTNPVGNLSHERFVS